MPRRLKIYLDTSVISHLEAPDAPLEQGVTRRLWEDFKLGKYEVVISDIVFDELYDCPEPKLSELKRELREIIYSERGVSEEAERLRDLYLSVGGLPPKSKTDALHLAVASVAGCNAVLSWNFKHIVTLRAMAAVETINMREGYAPLRIISPRSLTESEV